MAKDLKDLRKDPLFRKFKKVIGKGIETKVKAVGMVTKKDKEKED